MRVCSLFVRVCIYACRYVCVRVFVCLVCVCVCVCVCLCVCVAWLDSKGCFCDFESFFPLSDFTNFQGRENLQMRRH